MTTSPLMTGDLLGAVLISKDCGLKRGQFHYTVARMLGCSSRAQWQLIVFLYQNRAIHTQWTSTLPEIASTKRFGDNIGFFFYQPNKFSAFAFYPNKLKGLFYPLYSCDRIRSSPAEKFNAIILHSQVFASSHFMEIQWTLCVRQCLLAVQCLAGKGDRKSVV